MASSTPAAPPRGIAGALAMNRPRCLSTVACLLLVALPAASHAQAAPDPAASAAAQKLAPAKASHAAPLALSLTDEQRGRIEKVILEQGTNIEVPPPVVQILRFRPHEVAPKVRQASVLGQDGLKHGFALLVDNSGYLLFRRGTGTDLSVFRTDRQLQLIGAARQFEKDRFLELAPEEAQRELGAEIVTWARVLSPSGAVLPPPRPAGATAPPAPATAPRSAAPPAQ